MVERFRAVDLVEYKNIFVGPVEVVCNPHVILFCQSPYYKHPKGCPNWAEKEGCPPGIPNFLTLYEKDAFIVSVGMDFKAFLEKRALEHPDWNERELRNIRHWQSHLNMRLRHLAEEVRPDSYEVIYNPEAMQVDVFATCAYAGLFLEKNPTDWVHKVAFFGKKLEKTPLFL